MSEALCESPTCRRGGTRPGGARVCSGCLAAFTETLRQLPRDYHRCGELLQGERTRALPRRRGGRRHGIALADALVTARAEIAALAESWAALVVDEARPSRRPRRTVHHLVEFLVEHREWLAAHPAVADAIEEFADLHVRATAAIDPAPERIEVGRCARPGCECAVYAELGAAPGGHVRCTAGHAVPPQEWLGLRHAQVGTAERVA
ncbi:hypothetical protein [Nocardia sp. AG03]|uniref:hypothetical protein n=1 Tax=Nocardia sp. AG03 TaxID=3025312 RepID=UPI0024181FDD|nr:hypothetical protein [Nocardia sp. AG03]